MHGSKLSFDPCVSFLYDFKHLRLRNRYNSNREKSMAQNCPLYVFELKIWFGVPHLHLYILIYRWRCGTPNQKTFNSFIWPLHFFPIGIDTFKFLWISIIPIDKKCMVQYCHLTHCVSFLYDLKHLRFRNKYNSNREQSMAQNGPVYAFELNIWFGVPHLHLYIY